MSRHSKNGGVKYYLVGSNEKITNRGFEIKHEAERGKILSALTVNGSTNTAPSRVARLAT